MRINIVLLLIVFSFLFSVSCEKEDKTVNSDCANFTEALIYLKSDSVKKLIDKFTFDLNPDVKENDNWGQRENINLLIERLNSQCDDISANLGCYACIYTMPPQSEIMISTDSSGMKIKRIIDILTPKDDILKYLNVHEYNGSCNN